LTGVDAADGDPDIDTMPILAWSLKMAESAKDSAFGRFMIQWQAVFYFPVLLFARLAWAHQSWVFVFGGMGQWSVKNAKLDQSKMQYPTLERIAMVGHYLCLFAILYQMSLLNALIYFLVAQTSCGLFLQKSFGTFLSSHGHVALQLHALLLLHHSLSIVPYQIVKKSLMHVLQTLRSLRCGITHTSASASLSDSSSDSDHVTGIVPSIKRKEMGFIFISELIEEATLYFVHCPITMMMRKERR
jgi:hypothetical protein